MDNSKKWIIALGLVLIAGAVAAYFLFNGGSSNNATNQTSATIIQQSSNKDIVGIAAETKDLSTLSGAIKTAALSSILAGTGPYTILAPTNDAFKNVPKNELEILLKQENSANLEAVLKYHVIAGNVATTALTNGQRIKTVNGQELLVEITDGSICFIDAKGGKAKITTPDTTAANGTVHVINGVLLPQ